MEDSEKENEIKQEKIFEKRKEKIVRWFKDPYNLTFVIIFILAVAIRFYFFTLTKNQPLWWDEAEYMKTAKGFAGIISSDYRFALNRFPGFPLLASLFYIIGINNEVVLRFFLAFLPSIIVIFSVYFLMKEMYPDKKIGIISLVILALLWEHAFYSCRFQTENFSLIFGFFAIFILFKCYIKKENFYFMKSKHSLVYIALFSFLCVLFRSGNMIFLPAMFLFIIILNFYKFSRKLQISLFTIFVLSIISFFIAAGPLAQKYSSINLFYHYELPLAWNDFTVFYGFYQSFNPPIPSLFFYGFLLGIIFFLIGIFIFPERLKRLNLKSEDHEIKADIFNIILISAVLFFFIFMLRQNSFEYRWFFIFLPGMLAFTSKGIIKSSEYITSLFGSKKLSVLLIIIIMIIGSYTAWNHTDPLIKNKISSYQEVKEGGLWIKSNSNKNDLIVTASTTQFSYYAERNVIGFYSDSSNKNETAFNNRVMQLKPKYLVISLFEPGFTPEWAYTWPEKHSNSVIPVQAYFSDPEKKQLLLIIYEFKNFNFN